MQASAELTLNSTSDTIGAEFDVRGARLFILSLLKILKQGKTYWAGQVRIPSGILSALAIAVFESQETRVCYVDSPLPR